MRDYDYRGEWYLPNSDIKVPGRLLIDKDTKSITLEIYGNQTIEGSLITDLFHYEKQRFHPVILGEGMGEITLYNCWWSLTGTIGKEMYQIEYRADFIFYDVHLKDSNFLITAAIFIYPYLASWYDGWDSHGKINLDDTAEFGIKAGIKQENEDRITISENLTIIPFDKIQRRMEEIGIHHSIKYKKYIAFHYKSPVSFQDMVIDTQTFRNLLEFVNGKPILSKIVSVRIPNSYVSTQSHHLFHETDTIKIYVTNYTFNEGKDVDKHSQHQNNMLLSRWNCGVDELNQIIVKWFANKQLYNIYDYYNDSNNWLQETEARISNVMFNNRFLNLIQGLEDYYRKFINSEHQEEQIFLNKKKQVLAFVKDAALKRWLNDNFKPPKHIRLEEKLQAIIDEVKPYFLETLTTNPLFVSFPAYAKNKRNELAHGKNKETYQGEVFHLYFYLSQILLGICILKSLGITNVHRKIRNYVKWNDHLHAIVHYMPSNDE